MQELTLSLFISETAVYYSFNLDLLRLLCYYILTLLKTVYSRANKLNLHVIDSTKMYLKNGMILHS